MKFPNLQNLIFQITLICIVIAITNGNQEASMKIKSGIKKRIPKINEIKQDFLTQNTAKYILDNSLAKSDIENNSSRYKILSAHENAQNQMVNSMKVYEKDQQAYYNAYSLGAGANKKSQNEINEKNSKDAFSRYLNKVIYQKDQRPYYSPTPEYQVFSNAPKDKIVTPIELKDDLLNTASTYENLRNLEKNLLTLNKKEDLNTISLSGKYMKDPEPYYDAGALGRNEKKQVISQAIEKIKEGLIDKTVEYVEENFKVKTKIQNYQNANKENTNAMISESYYYEPKGIVNTTLSSFDKNTEAASPNHDVVEIESIGESLGSKYYEFDQKGRHLVDAEDKNIEVAAHKSTVHREAKKPEPIKKTNTESKNIPKADEKLKATKPTQNNNNDINKNNIISEMYKGSNLRVKNEENLIEKENLKPDTNGLKVQKIKILPIRRMAVADA